MSKGTIAQKERWALDLLTLDKIGAWAITEPGSGSDAFGVDEVDRPARRRRVPPQRLEDLHHQRPLRRHDRVHLQARRGQPARPSARSSPSCSTGACPGSSSRSRCARWACTRRPPASCSSPTCGSGATGCIGETEDVARRRPRGGQGHVLAWSARAWPPWRSGSSSSASSCASHYAKDRVQFGQPIGEFQLIQDKLARMEVARLNVAEPGVPLHRDVGGRARS